MKRSWERWRAARCVAERSFDCWRSRRFAPTAPPGVVWVRGRDRRADRRTLPGAPGPARSESRLELRPGEDARDARAVPGPRRVGQVRQERRHRDRRRPTTTVVREMMARGMRALTGAGTTPDAWRRFFDAGRRRRHQGQLRRLSALRLRLRDRGRDRPPAHGHRRSGVADLPLRAIPESARRGATTRRTCREGVQIVAAERANRYTDNSGYDPATYLEADLFGEEDTRSNMMRLVSAAADEDHQHPEHEGSRRHRRHRLPEEHRLRQLLERRAHAPARQVAHLLRRRHAGRASSRCARGRCCRSWTACAACGTAVRSRGRRATCSIRGRSCSAPIRSPSIACCSTSSRTKRQAEGAISIWDRSPASLKMDDTRARDADPNVNIIIREPGHVEYASTLGLGVYDRAKIAVQDIDRMTPLLLAALAALPCVYWTQGIESRPALEAAGIKRICVRAGTGRCLAGRRVRGQSDRGGGPRVARSAARPWHHRAGGPGLADAQPVGRRERLALRATARRPRSSTTCRPARRRSPPPKPSPTAPTRS